MRISRLAGAFAALALAAATLPVAAQVPKQPPSGRMYGYVLVDGAAPASGTVITTIAGSTACGQNDFNPDLYGGRYFVDLDSSQADCSQAGNQIVFLVNGCPADATGTVPSFNGAQRVDINAPSIC